MAMAKAYVIGFAGLLLLLPFPVHAAPATFFFTGHVNSEAINGCGVLVNCGVVTGTYTFDSAAPDQNPDPTEGLYVVTGITFSIDGVPFFSSATGFINVANFPAVDQYGLLATGIAANGSPATLSILLTDPTATAFSSDALPQSPSVLVKLLPGTFQLNAADDTFQLLGTIDTVFILPPGAGLLEVCKVAGAGIAVGTNTTFSVNGAPVIVPAGAAPAGSCSAPIIQPAGPVGVSENIPAGALPTAIAVLPTAALISSNVGAGTAAVTVNAGGLTIATFTDAAIANTAVLQICKVAGAGIAVGTSFTFNANGTALTIPAGSCSPLLAETPGAVAVSETIPFGIVLTNISTLPNPGLLVVSNLSAGTATVTVSIGTQTTVTFTDIAFEPFQVHYASHLNAGDSVINLTNTGALTLPGGLTTTGNICANIYTFDASEEMISCCSCLVTPNGLNSLSARSDLISNTLTPGVPTSIVIKLLASTPLGLSPAGTGGSCNPSSPNATPAGPGVVGSLVPGLLAWGTTIHALPTTPVAYGLTEERFEPAPLSPAELTKLTTFCGFIQANGSGFGICKSCRTGGLGAASK
jgi:hypothetical protein